MKLYEYKVIDEITAETYNSSVNSVWGYIIRLSNWFPFLSILFALPLYQPIEDYLCHLFNILIKLFKKMTTFQKDETHRAKSSTQAANFSTENQVGIINENVSIDEMNVTLKQVKQSNEFTEAFKYLCTCTTDNKVLARKPIRVNQNC